MNRQPTNHIAVGNINTVYFLLRHDEEYEKVLIMLAVREINSYLAMGHFDWIHDAQDIAWFNSFSPRDSSVYHKIESFIFHLCLSSCLNAIELESIWYHVCCDVSAEDFLVGMMSDDVT